MLNNFKVPSSSFFYSGIAKNGISHFFAQICFKIYPRVQLSFLLALKTFRLNSIIIHTLKFDCCPHPKGRVKLKYHTRSKFMESQPQTTNFQAWMLAARPKTLPAAIAPVLLGWAIAWSTGVFHLGAGLAALFTAIMIQIATNMVNDVVDFSKGADTEERTGPTRVTQTGLLSPRQVWTGVAITFGLAALAGIYLTWLAGWPVLVIGAAAILSGIAYTAGPFPLAYNGLGDLFVLIFFGYAAVGGTVFVISGQLPALTWYGSTAAGLLTVNILVVNNIRDIETDRKAGRTNFPVLFGRKAAVWQYMFNLTAAYLTPLLMISLGLASPWALLSFLSLPMAAKLVGVLRSNTAGKALNATLSQTGKMLLLYCVLLSIGLLL